jgi:hypothetical protein
MTKLENSSYKTYHSVMKVSSVTSKSSQIATFVVVAGSLDCMHWPWDKCPYGWKGQYTHGDHGVPTIILEAVASHDRWIWHAFFGVARSNNDINVLNQSDLLSIS